jgi:flavin-dependent dehydrogenase
VDVIVVGAGPAGSLAALLLARAKLDVVLIEQKRFPRDKVCGECLSAVGIDVLQRHGLIGLIEAHHPARLTHAVLHPAQGDALTLALPESMIGLTRRRMDVVMLEAARSAGVRVLQPARCERIEPGEPVRIRYRSLDAAIRELQASVVVVADGRPRDASPTGEFGVKFHLKRPPDWPAHAIELFSLGDDVGYVGTASVEGGLINLASAVTEHMVSKFRGGLDALARHLIEGHPALRRRISDRVATRSVLTCPLPRHRWTDWPDGVIPVGNAARAIEPIGGEGMGMALRSAEIACGQVVTAADAGRRVDRHALNEAYDACWSTRSLACRLSALGLRNEGLGAVATEAGRISPWLGRAAMAWVGKGPVGR